ncbi:hypothetical protein [Cognatishimia activa]|uniref:hypothetical protein n=1 Tax=Cognatishimia activa TaxID=1715691 RepID=UPI00222F4BB4|nr:hypothetical protein [Cognatishimia activa]UZD90048.1 hypothetical protein M0D42_10645 [Cognatishimia activa]
MGERYKYAWSPHDIEELYDLQSDPHERLNLAELPEFKALKQMQKDKLFEWMAQERDALVFGGYQLPVGSYIDGRDITEQHQHEPQP